jgi:hypothetical protein
MMIAAAGRNKTDQQLGELTQPGINLWMDGVRSMYQLAKVKHEIRTDDELWALARHYLMVRLPDEEEEMMQWFRAVLIGEHNVTLAEAKVILPTYACDTPLIDSLRVLLTQGRPTDWAWDLN